MVCRKMDQPRTCGILLDGVGRRGRECRKMPRRGMGFRDVVEILIIPVDGVVMV